jgi:hypothetical protein
METRKKKLLTNGIKGMMYFKKKIPKYRNKKTVVDGITFDSIHESEVYRELKMLEKRGLIQSLELQRRFAIVPKIKGVKGSRTRYYVSDFTFQEVGKTGETTWIIADAKSPITRKNPVYTLKKQLVQWQYPQYEFREY